MNISKKILSIVAISSMMYTAITLPMQQPRQQFRQQPEQQLVTHTHIEGGVLTSYLTPRGMTTMFTRSTDGKVFPVYGEKIIFTTQQAERVYPKIDLNKVKFTKELGAFCSNGKNSGPGQ